MIIYLPCLRKDPNDVTSLFVAKIVRNKTYLKEMRLQGCTQYRDI